MKNEVYDHHAAIYFLLQEKYNRAKLSLNKDQLSKIATPAAVPKTEVKPSDVSKAPVVGEGGGKAVSPSRHLSFGESDVDQLRRRPSTIAEQALSGEEHVPSSQQENMR